MNLVHVIPIAKGLSKDTLSYFSSEKISLGSIVSVPLRSKHVPGVVVKVEEAQNAKSQLRSSSFAIKKIAQNSERKFFLPEFIRASQKTAHYFGGTAGAALHLLIPKILLDSIDTFPTPKITAKKNKIDSDMASESLISQADEQNRISNYKSLVREEFARKGSVFMCVPTIRDAEFITENLHKGIEKYVFTLHSEIPKKELLKRIAGIIEEDHPILIVATPSFLAVPRKDIRTIVVEKENSRSYKRQVRPFIDMKVFAKLYAEELKARILFADMPLSIETMWKYRQKEYEELTSTRSRVVTPADQYIIDMRPDKSEEKKDFFTLSSQLVDTIVASQKTGDQTFIFNVRKGLAPTTVCEDCGSVVTCTQCHSPVVLHQAKDANVFICYACGDMRSAKERCHTCHSWKLKALGIGVDRIKEELAGHIKEEKIFSIDGNATKTHKQAKKVIDAFYKTPGGVLIGTELSLSFLRTPVHNTAIASIDSLLSLPDPKVYEHIFSLITKVRSQAKTAFFLQTRQPDLSFITQATEGNVSGFYDKEIVSRKRFDYPPFKTLIKITATGTQSQVIKEMEHVEQFLKGYMFQIYPAFTPIGKNRYMLSGLLRIQSELWPHEKLLSKLKALPPHITINVSPSSTL